MERCEDADGWLPSFQDHVKQCLGQSEVEATFHAPTEPRSLSSNFFGRWIVVADEVGR